MKKRLIAFVCMAVMALGIFALTATSANAAEKVTYKVGYAKVSISPWKNPYGADTDVQLLHGIKLSGYGSAEYRYTSDGTTAVGKVDNTHYYLTLADDNGDGKLTRADGLYATCTVVTEVVGGKEGKALVFFTMDTLNGYDYVTADMREWVPQLLSSANIASSQIMVSGSHCHTAPMMNNLRAAYRNEWNSAKTAGTTSASYIDYVPTGSNDAIYYKYVLSQMLSAAEEAYASRQDATISTKSVDASEVMGVQMNYIRHYTADYQIVKEGWWSDTTLETGNHIHGSNFGLSDGQSFGGSWSNKTVANVTSSTRKHVADAEDTLQLVKFDVAAADEDVVFVTWQAHPDNVSYKGLSADYVSGLRYRMENNRALTGDSSKENYRVAFFQGAAGNLVASSVVDTEWTGLTATGLTAATYGTSSSGSNKNFSYNQYGYLMGQVALSGLETGSDWKNISGAIRNMQAKYAADPTVYSEAEIAASAYYYANGGGTFPYTYTYTHADGSTEAVILNSIHHANHIREIGNSREGSYINMELNTIILGDGANSLAFVTAPGEMFDRYNSENVFSYEDSATSGWGSIVSSATYGTPIILGYSNAATGYIPNSAAYHYNQDPQTGKPASQYIGVGSYEANTSNYKEGTGEQVMAEYKKMLQQTAGLKQYCDHCEKEVEFAPLAQGGMDSKPLSGHYYLTEDITNSIISIVPGRNVCLDLNGYTLENTANRVFYVGDSGATQTASLSIIDKTNTGVIQAKQQPMYIQRRGVVNMYGGNLKSTSSDAYAGSGGTVYITHLDASFTLHDGTVYGTNVYKEGSTCYGGAVYLWSDSASDYATFTMNGGTVYGSTADRGGAIANLNSVVNLNGGTIVSGGVHAGGIGDCVYVSHTNGKLNISGDVNVESIYLDGSSVSFGLTGTFTGDIPGGITFASKTMSNGLTLGTCVSGAKIDASVKVYGKTTSGTWYLNANGTRLFASASEPAGTVASIGTQKYNSLEEAIAAHTPGAAPENNTECIVLHRDVTDTVSISKTVYLDLNGHDVKASVGSSGKLYVMDSATDDYNSPSSYSVGTLTVESSKDSSAVQAVPAGSGVIGSTAAVDVIKGNFYSCYVMLSNGNDHTFHRLDVGINAHELNLATNGVRYDCGFYGDQFITDYFDFSSGKYGVAVSVAGDPYNKDSKQMHTGNGYAKTEFSRFEAGSAGNGQSSSYINNIMKITNDDAVNKRNAEQMIYGRAYLQIGGGQLICGPLVTTTLKQTVETVDQNWNDISNQSSLFAKQVYNFYESFKSVVKRWDISNIIDAAEELAMGEEEQTLKILTLGNSHSIDAMHMLYEVYKNMNPEQKVELGILYYSGCPINKHVTHIKENTPAYVYYKISDEINAEKNGWQQTPETTVYTALQDEQWDLIVLQQMSNYSAFPSYYTDGNLEWLIGYIKEYAQGTPELAFHMSWTHPMTDNYVKTSGIDVWEHNMDNWFSNKDGVIDEKDDRLAMQRKMHQMMIESTQAYFDTGKMYDDDFAYTFISGSAVHYAFEQYLEGQTVTNDLMTTYNTKLYRDYTHLSDYSRLMVAYLWYAELNGYNGTTKALSASDVVTTVPSKFWLSTKTSGGLSLSKADQQMIADAVNYALANPYVLPWS